MTWIICFSMAVMVILLGIILFFTMTRKKNGFIFFLFIAVFALTVLSFPVERLTNQFSVFESIFAALLDAIEDIRGDVYQRINIDNQPAFSLIYTSLYLVVQTTAIMFTVGTVLTILRVPLEWFRRRIIPKNIIILSSYNEKTRAIAESYCIEKPEEKVKIFFANCVDISSEEKKEIFEIGAVYLSDSTAKLLKCFAKRKKRIHAYIFEENDEGNIFALGECLRAIEKNPPKERIRIFVELNEMSWDEQNAIKNTLHNDNVILNFIRTEENFALNNLYENSIFENVIEKDGIKNINVLIVGVDGYSVEMIKNVLTLGQMPGYFLHMYVADTGNGYSDLRYQIPELRDYVNEIGYAAYSFDYFENINPRSLAFEELIAERFIDFTFAFVNLHDHQKNIDVCRLLNMMRIRNEITNACTIQMMDFSQKENPLLKTDALKNTIIVGTMSYIYSHSYIECGQIERLAMNIHIQRHGDKKPWSEYCNNEYSRRSTFNRALCDMYKQQIIEKYYDGDMNLLNDDETWLKYEHMRWVVYTQTIGYVFGKEKSILAKTHYDLVNYNEISEDEKKKDKKVFK